MNNDLRCKLNIMTDGDRVFEHVYPTYFAMMNDARAQRDKVAAEARKGAFVVAQYQRMGPYGWMHGAILS